MKYLDRFFSISLTSFFVMALPSVAPSQVLTVIHSFGSGVDGTAPIGGLILAPNGTLYGTTSTGGKFDGGTVFALAPPSIPGGSWSETVLYNFDAKNPIGSTPYAGVIFGPDGKLYGTAETGGPCNCGSAFSLTPPAKPGGAWTADVIHAFTGQPTFEPGDGANPYAPLVLGAAGDLYGTTEFGGICCGIIFKLNPPTSDGEPWTLQKLYGFSGYQDDGVFEESPVAIGKSGELYGVTSGGGHNDVGLSAGVVFDVTPSSGEAWHETVIRAFNNQPTDGNAPYGGLVIAPSGTLYGTTYYGGDGAGCGDTNGCGTVFEMIPPSSPEGAWSEALLYNFGATATDGAYPYFGTLLLGNNGTLYGTTSGGGLTGMGEIFALLPPIPQATAWTKVTLYDFTGTPNDGASPYNGLIAGPNGTFFGTTYAGGSLTANCPMGCGTVFQLTQ